MTLIPSLTFTDYEWFPWSICNGCGMPAGNAYPSGHLVPSPFWDLLMLQLLRPNSSNLPCLYSTFHLEYPLVLSRFCLVVTHSYVSQATHASFGMLPLCFSDLIQLHLKYLFRIKFSCMQSFKYGVCNSYDENFYSFCLTIWAWNKALY